MARGFAVRRSHPAVTHTCLYRGESETETEIEVEVYGLIEPYFAGSRDEPASGGEADDVRAIFLDGKKQREIQISSDEAKDLSEHLIETSMDYEPDPEPDEDFDEPEPHDFDEPEGF